MKKLCLLLFFAASTACVLRAQIQTPTTVIVESGHTSFFTALAVTAAYAVDSTIVQADAVPGGVRLAGKAPGETTVILATTVGTRTITVTVPQPIQPRGASSLGSGSSGQTVEFGQYEFRYNNNPNQIGNTENVTQILGDRQIHVQIMNTNLYPSPGESPVGFPIISYSISRPGQRITFLDDMMNNTDLTMSGTLLRGFHIQAGPWEFHVGITSVTEFQDFLLPANRYEVGGISRHFVLNPRSSFEGNFYYFKTDTNVNTDATPGGIATLYYRYMRGEHLKTSAEIGVGDGIATSDKVDADSGNHQFHADFHYQSPRIASLGVNELHGRTADVNWNEMFAKRLQMQLYGSDTSINLSMERQEIDTLTFNQTFWINPHFGFVTGLTASHFVSRVPYAPSISSAGYLAGPQLLWKHFGSSFEFQQLRNSGTTPDSINYQVNAQGSTTHMSLSAFFNSQSQSPVFTPVQSSHLSLRETLRRESEISLGPAQMAQFLRDTSPLNTQGDMQPVAISIASQRTQYGGTLDWSSDKAGHFSLNGIVDTSSGGSVPNLKLETGGVIWTRKLGNSNLLNAGFSMYHTVTGGQSSTEPVIQFSLQHQLYSAPRWLIPGRRGTIQGHVFIDKALIQNYSPDNPPLADVAIFLDGHRITQTAKDGYFILHGVPFGTHRVEAAYHDSRAFYFTSSSPKTVTTGSTADFGVSFASGHIFGKLADDTGAGLPATFMLEGNGVRREVSTDGEGNLEVEGLPDGVYRLSPMISSLPPGYNLSQLEDQSIAVTAQQSGHFHLMVQAQRSIAGRVQLYDSSTGQNSPVAGIEVLIDPSQRTARTDSQGRYVFRQMPAGAFTVTVRYGDRSYSRTIQLSSIPDTERDVDLIIPIVSAKLIPKNAAIADSR